MYESEEKGKERIEINNASLYPPRDLKEDEKESEDENSLRKGLKVEVKRK